MAGLLCRLLLLCLAAAGTSSDLVLEEVRRSLDLSTHLAKISAELSLSNAPGGAAASTFLLALEPGLEPRLAHLGVQVSEGSEYRAPSAAGAAGAARPRARRDTSALPGPQRRSRIPQLPGTGGVCRGLRAGLGGLGGDEGASYCWAGVAASTAGAGLAAPDSEGRGPGPQP